MQNEKAIAGIRHILSKLECEDIIALASTVTQGYLRNKLTTAKGKD